MSNSRRFVSPTGLVAYRRVATIALFATIAAVGFAPSAHAQGTGRGFLFQQPEGSLALRLGFTRATARSDLFDETTDVFTLDRGDFGGFSLAADAGFVLKPRVDVVLTFAMDRSSSNSDYENFEEEGPTPSEDDDLPIEQTTTFNRSSFSIGGKFFLTPRGRQVGNLAFIPARYAPFIGAGGGIAYFSFAQKGSFVEEATLNIFDDELESTGFTPVVYGAAGLDYTLSPRLALTGEARYTYGKAAMNGDYATYDKIDLSGLAVTMGLFVRF
jgi:hypothetical protein